MHLVTSLGSTTYDTAHGSHLIVVRLKRGV
jgi:hypothetical protein